MKEWSLRRGLWTAVYAVLYAVMTAIVCVFGAIHPVLDIMVRYGLTEIIHMNAQSRKCRPDMQTHLWL